MLRKYFSLALSVLLLNAVAAQPAFAGSGRVGQSVDAAKVKAAVAKVGVGKSAYVQVRLLDNTKLKGYVKVAREDDFIVANEKDGTEVTVPYSQVKRLRGDNLSSGARVAVTVAGIVGVISLIGLILWGANQT